MNNYGNFIPEGHKLYPEAKLAAFTFESELTERLARVIDSRKTWGPFKPGRRRAEAKGSREDGWWISLTLWGELAREEAALDVGFWWNAPDAPHGAVITASFYEPTPNRLLAFAYDRSVAVPEVKAFSCFGRTQLAVEMPADLNPTIAVGLELDVLVKVMLAGT